MSDASITTMTPPPLNWPPAPRSKWEREYQAFRRLLPELLLSDRGKYVAIHDERVLDRDVDETALIQRVLARLGNVDIHVGLVTDEPERVYRSGIVRDLFSQRTP